jgi:8-oxo-dGTP pyrophosphatase MutT (NUDIX family)
VAKAEKAGPQTSEAISPAVCQEVHRRAEGEKGGMSERAEYVPQLRRVVGGAMLLQIPAVTVVLRDDEGRVLLARHVENDQWLLPGGTIEPGENPADAAIREMWEETGLVVRLTSLVGVFGGPNFIVQYRNGDRTSYVTAVFEARSSERDPHLDNKELLEIRFASEPETKSLSSASWVAEILSAVFQGRRGTFRAPTWTPPH